MTSFEKKLIAIAHPMSYDMTGYDFMPEVYDYFEKEYAESDLLYRGFIASKNLGLLTSVTRHHEELYGKGIHCDYYIVADPMKWFLAKIKYGF